MSARSTISVFACGMSIPDSMIAGADEHVGVAAQERAASARSSSRSSICPWATSKRIPGHRPRSRTAVSSIVSTRLCRKNAWPPRSFSRSQRAADELLVVLADVGLDRPPSLGRGLDHADVAHPGQRHLQRARDRRGAHRDHVDPQLQLAQQLLLLDAEALLLVDDQQPEVLGADVAREQPVGADQDVDLALGERARPPRAARRRGGSATRARSSTG